MTRNENNIPLGGKRAFRPGNDRRLPVGHAGRLTPGVLHRSAGAPSKHGREWHGQLVHATRTPPWVTRRINRRRNKAARRARKVTRRNG